MIDVAALLGGLAVTLRLMAISSVLGMALAVVVSAARVSGVRVLAWPSVAFSSVFRGTPLLVQIYLTYYGLAQFAWVRHSFAWAFLRHAWGCALLAFTLNMAAYVSEVIRGGLLAVPRGEREAGLALGLSGRQCFRLVVLPRGLRLIAPALGNELIVQMKATSLASTITLLDLTGVARRMAAASYTMTPLLVAGVVYAGMAYGLGGVVRGVERRVNRFAVR